MKLEIVCSIIQLESFKSTKKWGHSVELYFCWMRSSTRYTDSGDEMDCDGVIGETGVNNSDWVYSSCGDQSDNEGAGLSLEAGDRRNSSYKTKDIIATYKIKI
jgi:hypothetical protein